MMIDLGNMEELVDINSIVLCERFDYQNVCLRDPWKIRELRANGVKMDPVEKASWEDLYYIISRSGLKFMTYEDEFLKVLVGYTPTETGGIKKQAVAVKSTDGTYDNESKLVYLWDAENPETRLYVKEGDWRDKHTQAANAASFLYSQFYTGI